MDEDGQVEERAQTRQDAFNMGNPLARMCHPLRGKHDGPRLMTLYRRFLRGLVRYCDTVKALLPARILVVPVANKTVPVDKGTS